MSRKIKLRIFSNRIIGLFIPKSERHLVTLDIPWSMAVGASNLDSPEVTEPMLADSKYAYVSLEMSEDSELWNTNGASTKLYTVKANETSVASEVVECIHFDD